ncbi:MAG: HipA domain-containing protein [Eubacteriales bacterium]|nr:HipA domain-containing protein [Eubacteriales bacterium]
MNCLCCGKPLNTAAALNQWHKKCIKAFFNTAKFPDIDISEEVLNQLAIDSINKGFTVPGVQKKLSLHLTEEDTPRLTLVNYPTGYILKPQTEEYKALPELEYLVMRMAQASGIKTVPFALLRMGSHSSPYAYITRRIDRIFGENPGILAMEDFCQLDGRLTEDKYRGSYERCGKIITKHSIQPGLDLSELYLRVVFFFAVGNSDMHLKNFSLIETAPGSGEYVLSAAYDMLSTNIVLPADQEQFALAMNGKKQNIRRNDFLHFADTIGISRKSAEKLIDQIVKREEIYIEMCRASYMPTDMKEAMETLIRERLDILRK